MGGCGMGGCVTVWIDQVCQHKRVWHFTLVSGSTKQGIVHFLFCLHLYKESSSPSFTFQSIR